MLRKFLWVTEKPSFAALQQIPLISRGLLIPDLIAIIASIDFVMADVDR